MSIGKKLRFNVFDRDGFTCKYCGEDSSSVKLEVDHIIPVSKGGPDEMENLVTSCFDCNRGKSDSTLGTNAPTEASRLRRMQELHEQREAAEALQQSIDLKAEARQQFINAYCDIVGREDMDSRTASVLFHHTTVFGTMQILEWVELAFNITNGRDVEVGKYVSGICRKKREAASSTNS